MRTITLILALALPVRALAEEPDYAALAVELAELRAEVERTETALTARRAHAEASLHALVEQQSELQVLIQREQLRLDGAREQILELQAAAGDRGAEVQALAPIVVRHAEALMAEARRAAPFRLEDRLAELEAVRDGVASGAMDPRAGAARLWRHVEDELKLCEEAGLARQAVPLEGGAVLAQVAHLGLVALFFRTDDGRFGRAVPADDGWRYEVLGGGAARALATLFDALDKGVRSGAFRLPLEPPAGLDLGGGL
ncbi:MAG: DUF3450 family protein [Pseudomonadota bacterium]